MHSFDKFGQNHAKMICYMPYFICIHQSIKYLNLKKKNFLVLFYPINRVQILLEWPKMSFNVSCWLSWTILHQNDISHAILISNPLICPSIKYIKKIFWPLFHLIKGAQNPPKMPKMNFHIFL